MQRELLALAGARQGHFRFESGHHGELWLDLGRLFRRPSHLKTYVAELARRLAQHDVEVVCGPQFGGSLLALLVAEELDRDCVFLCREIEGDMAIYRLPPSSREVVHGRRIAVVDDAINAGSAVRATLGELRLAGANVVVIGSLITLGSTADKLCAEHKTPLESLVQVPGQIWMPEECPQCAAGVALDKIV